jgi:hypothetical protein
LVYDIDCVPDLVCLFHRSRLSDELGIKFDEAAEECHADDNKLDDKHLKEAILLLWLGEPDHADQR